MSETARIVLASRSTIRAEILRSAGVSFDIQEPGVDEAVIKRAAEEDGAGLEETAMMLAEAKCISVARQTNALVIGADQVLEFNGRAYDKPKDMMAARRRLSEMQGAKHTLINAVAVARDGKVIWRGLDRPALFMRALTDAEINLYLKAAGPEILNSVGAYQFEKSGSRLFERIEGDHYAILGLSLLPLLALLRSENALDY